MNGQPEPMVRRLKALVDPIHMVTYLADEPTEALLALGYRNSWDAYFAGRAAPLGRVPAEVVHAILYNFAPGEVARHLPRVWDIAPPEAALAARERGCVASLRRILGDLADSPSVARAADLALRAGTSAPTEGRILYAALRALPVPEEPVARLWHAATLLREYRGDGHIVALVAEGIGGTEAHVLGALRRHPGGEVRPGLPPPRGPARRGHRRDAGPRPGRRLRLAHRGRPGDPGAGRGADRHPGRADLRRPGAGRAGSADGRSRAPGRRPRRGRLPLTVIQVGPFVP